MEWVAALPWNQWQASCGISGSFAVEYAHDIISLEELQRRCQTIASELQQIDRERQRLVRSQQQKLHWQQIIDHAEGFRKLLGDNLEGLSFEER
jgi:hypothetical protein